MAVRVAVIGNINVDFVFRVARMPRPGETLAGDEFLTAPGGKGANQAVAAARLGAEVAFVGCVGDDDLGRAMVRNLAQEGVDVSRVRTAPDAATGTALILVDRSGENTIVVALGANEKLTPAELNSHAGLLAGCDVLLLQQEMSLETVDEAIRLGLEAGCRVVLDPAPARDRLPSRWREVDVLSPNESEADTILDALGSFEVGRAEDRAAAFVEQGVKLAALKLGSEGCVVASEEGIFRVEAFPTVPVDTTAAGDAFTAGLAVALAEGMAPREAARFANACGALATTRMGAQPSMPSRAEVKSLLGG